MAGERAINDARVLYRSKRQKIGVLVFSIEEVAESENWMMMEQLFAAGLKITPSIARSPTLTTLPNVYAFQGSLISFHGRVGPGES